MRITFGNTYANVAATAALVLALGGTSYAATSVVGHHGAGSSASKLAASKTMTGAWGQSALGTSTDDIQTDTISYPKKLGKNVKVVIRQDGSSNRRCPGTNKSPKARPGFLCIYVGNGVNHDSVKTYSPVNGNDQPGEGNYRHGAVVYWFPTSADFTYATGTWAVTPK